MYLLYSDLLPELTSLLCMTLCAADTAVTFTQKDKKIRRAITQGISGLAAGVPGCPKAASICARRSPGRKGFLINWYWC